MKITIKVQEFVPYTTVEAVAEASIAAEELDSYKNADGALAAFVSRLRAEVNRRVDEEMKARDIVLGPDGLRLERPTDAGQRQAPRE